METLEWMEKILPKVVKMASADPEQAESLKWCRELEETYSYVMAGLEDEDRAAIDAYFMACQKVNMHLMRLSYQKGLSDGRSRKK